MRPIDADELKERIIENFGPDTTAEGIMMSGILDAINLLDAQEDIKLKDLMEFVSKARNELAVGDATATTSISDMVDIYEAIPTKNIYKCPGCGKKVHLISEYIFFRSKYDKYNFVARCECCCGWGTPDGYGKTRKRAIKKGKELANRCAEKWRSKK